MHKKMKVLISSKDHKRLQKFQGNYTLSSTTYPEGGTIIEEFYLELHKENA